MHALEKLNTASPSLSNFKDTENCKKKSKKSKKTPPLLSSSPNVSIRLF